MIRSILWCMRLDGARSRRELLRFLNMTVRPVYNQTFQIIHFRLAHSQFTIWWKYEIWSLQCTQFLETTNYFLMIILNFLKTVATNFEPLGSLGGSKDDLLNVFCLKLFHSEISQNQILTNYKTVQYLDNFSIHFTFQIIIISFWVLQIN